MKVELIKGEGCTVHADISWTDVSNAMRLRTRIIDILKSHKTEEKKYISDEDLKDVLGLMIALSTRVEHKEVLDEETETWKVETTRIDLINMEEQIDVESYLN